MPISSSEPAQGTDTSTVVAQAHARLSTSVAPPSTEPSVPAAHPPGKSQNGHPTTKKRRREPESDPIRPVGTSDRAIATLAAADRDVGDDALVRKKQKKKKDGAAQK